MKKIIFSTLILLFALASCDQDNIATTFDAKGIDYVAVGVSEVGTPYALNADNNYSISFPLHRTDIEKEGTTATLELISDNGSELFELENETITFEKGEGVAYAEIVALSGSSLAPGATYEFELTVTSDNASFLENTASFSAQLELNFGAAVSGSFFSEAFGGEWGQEIQKADGLNIYKAISLYETGLDILIIEDVDAGTVSVPSQKAWLYDSSYGYVSVQGEGTVTTVDGKKVYTMALDHFLPSIDYSFGVFTEELTFP